MSDEPDASEVSAAREFNKRQHEVMQREIVEAEANKYQLVLDRWWQSQRDFEAEMNDPYMVGGFMERWSQTPSYTKARTGGCADGPVLATHVCP